MNETLDEDDDELEFIDPKSTENKSLKDLLNMNKKMLYTQRFENQEQEQDNGDISKRKKLE